MVYKSCLKGGFANPGILFELNARVKIKPQQHCPVQRFYFCDKTECGHNKGICKGS